MSIFNLLLELNLKSSKQDQKRDWQTSLFSYKLIYRLFHNRIKQTLQIFDQTNLTKFDNWSFTRYLNNKLIIRHFINYFFPISFVLSTAASIAFIRVALKYTRYYLVKNSASVKKPIHLIYQQKKIFHLSLCQTFVALLLL